jgi:hypothetical protein
MKILYNNDGIPFILSEDEKIIDFNTNNQNYIVGELATDMKSIKSLFSNVQKTIDSKVLEYQKSPKNNFADAKLALDNFRKILQLAYVIDVCNDAEDFYFRLTTPKEYESWIWDSSERKWVPPYPIPYGEPGEHYKWDEEHTNWVFAKERPSLDWSWSAEIHDWVPPIQYPIDAAPGEFIWDSESSTWVLNTES